MTGEVIKSFLVGLGFGVDEGSLAKFNKAISSASLRVAALYGSIKIASAGIVYGLTKISEGFEQMGYEYRIIAPAINKALLLRREMLKAYAAAGINITKVIQASVKLNFSLAKTRMAFQAIYQSVASRFFDTLTKQSDAFRKTIYANMPKIQNFLERFIKFIFKALEATTALGMRLWSILSRVYDFFVMLDTATDGWSTRILAVIAAWKLLNLSFLATPLGALLAGFAALLALWDDFKTWQEGGKSLFDWSGAIPTINALAAALQAVWDILNGIADIVGTVALGFYQLFKGDTQGLKDTASSAWSGIKNTLGGVASQVLNPFGGTGAQTTPYLLPNGQPSQTNQNVRQQTNINVIGSADASAVGKAVSGEQSKVNFDMVRNMKGATR